MRLRSIFMRSFFSAAWSISKPSELALMGVEGFPSEEVFSSVKTVESTTFSSTAVDMVKRLC